LSKSVGQIDSFVASVASFVDAHDLIPTGSSVLVGVSGGADSVALLAVLRDLADRPNRRWSLSAAHLNHALRGEAQADADFVAELTSKWSIPCVVETRYISEEAQTTGRGIEETARNIRYEFLSGTASEQGATVVAVGHHADDNAETILYRIARGTHLRGLSGIAAERPLGDGKVQLVRPLLGSTRREVEQFCRRRGLVWREDLSNRQLRYRRNFIRHELLPLMREKLNPRIDEALIRLADGATQAEQYLSACATAAMDQAIRPAPPGCVALAWEELAGHEGIIQKYVGRLAAERAGVPLRKMSMHLFGQLAEMLAGRGASAMDLSGGYIARIEGDLLIISPEGSEVRRENRTVELLIPGSTDCGDGLTFECRQASLNKNEFANHCRGHSPGVELLDADEIRGTLVCRPWIAGDEFRPLGCGGRQTVSDFLTNCKIPHAVRAQIRCVCDETGIVYLAPLRIDDRTKVTRRTRRTLWIEARGWPGLERDQ